LSKILVVFTGGTIGSKKTQKMIDIDQSTSYELIYLYENSDAKQAVTLDTIHPLNVLSENLVPEDWVTLAHAIRHLDLTSYQGIIVTHGTDTLPFTSAALSYIFNDISIPITMIASNFPLNDPRSTGLNNFTQAIEFILGHPLPGVFVFFENNKGEMQVHLGTRLMPSDPFTDQYDSTYAVPFGSMENGHFIWNSHQTNPTIGMVKARRKLGFDKSLVSFSLEVLYIKPHPGLDYQYYDFWRQKPQAVLHDLYHSGTACALGKDTIRASLPEFITYCKSQAVDVFIAPLKNQPGDLYASSLQLIEAGAIALGNISIEAAQVKLMLAYGSFAGSVERMQFMKHPLFFEFH
jgi:L-asparaginase